MRAWRWPLLGLVVGLGMTVVLSAAAGPRGAVPGPVPAFSAAELTALPADNWVGYNGNVFNQRHSTLNQITRSNVRQLRVAWRTRLVIPGVKLKPGAFGILSEQTPVAYGGVLYMPDANNRIWAFDATTGERIWVHRPKVAKGFDRAVAGLNAFPSRGVAIGDGKVYFGDGDASITALNASTGRVVWKKSFDNWKRGYFFSNAPLYYDGMLITGQSGGDGGAASKVLGIDADTGKLLWRFKVIPEKPSDPGYNTWPKVKAYSGGGAMWNTPAVDPALGLVYIGVGNPIPYSGVKRLPGKELFTESVLALRAKTGKLAWYYQTVHHDIWDYDVTNPMILFDLPYRGQMRKGIAHAGKTGWVYLLDRTNGKPLIRIRERKVPQSKEMHTWPTQPYPVGDAFAKQCADPKDYTGVKGYEGKPLHIGCIFKAYSTTRTTVLYPSAGGGANWPPSAYSPQTGYMYICANDNPFYLKSVPASDQVLKPRGDFFQLKGGFQPPKGAPRVPSTGHLTAMNLRTNRIAWKRTFRNDSCYSGVLSTAGGLIFVGRTRGFLEAYDARNGSLIWRSRKLQGGANAAPMTYTANGKQYVAVYAGGNGILVFSNIKVDVGVSLYTFELPS